MGRQPAGAPGTFQVLEAGREQLTPEARKYTYLERSRRGRPCRQQRSLCHLGTRSVPHRGPQ
eukprot:7567852-Pyramimonas_sp.AAC.1